MQRGARHEDVVRRATAAVAAAVGAVARARLVPDAGPAVADGPMTARCAWCGHFLLGQHWLTSAELPPWARRSPFVGQTHTICPTCLAALKRDGRSH